MIRRVVRLLVYEGPAEWVSSTFERNWVPNGGVQQLPNGATIRATIVDDVSVNAPPLSLVYHDNLEDRR